MYQPLERILNCRLQHISDVTEICNELRQEKFNQAKKLNLNSNLIDDQGVKQLLEMLNSGILPHLKELDLGLNRISEKSMPLFIPLLKRDNFKYLVIYGNGGGRTTLINSFDEQMELSEIYKYISKVIWVRVEWLDYAIKRELFTDKEIKNHKKYYTKN